jgi:hypothetical protein
MSTMKSIPVPGFCGPTYLAASPVMDAERAINLYPEPGGKHSKSDMMLIGRPGLLSPPFTTLANAPVRGIFAGDERMFAVGGSHFYEIGNAGIVITDYGVMDFASTLSPVQIVANGTQLLVMDFGANVIYNANTGGPTMDPVFNGRALEYLDGFYIAIDAADSTKINVSAYLDGTTWNALDTVQVTGGSDYRNQLAVLNGQLWIFGQSTTEIWYNAGNPLFPFARVPGATLNFGCLAPFSVVKFYNTIMWLGCDPNGVLQVYMTQGTNPIRVSNPAIEQQILGITATSPEGIMDEIVYTRAYGYQENGHTFYVLLTCNSSWTPQAAYVYDLTTGMWHERAYAGAFPACFANIPGILFSTSPGYVGDAKSGAIYHQGQGYPSDAGTPIVYTRTFPHIADRNHFIKYPLLELDCDIGSAQVVLSYSNDGGKTFPYTRAAISGSGETSNGSLPRFRWWQCGRSRDRVFKFIITTSTQLIKLINAYVGVSASEEP